LNFIEETNAKNLSYSLGLNQFADLTRKEFAARNTANKSPRPAHPKFAMEGKNHTLPHVAAPDSWDWCTRNVVEIPQNQGQCGCCYAFGTTGAVASAWAVAHGNLYGLSEQEIMDCSSSYGNNGCTGGFPASTFQYIGAHGIAYRNNYPYVGRQGTCQNVARSGIRNTQYVNVAQYNENAMVQANLAAVLLVELSAETQVFQFYKAGILDDASCGTTLDHVVNVVGYGISNGIPYWKVKNSWGTTWGQQGFIFIVRNKNMCGIASVPQYPSV